MCGVTWESTRLVLFSGLKRERGLVFKAGEFEILSPGFCSLFQEKVSIHDTVKQHSMKLDNYLQSEFPHL